ncbi:MAG: coproporphyrinogen-III oxidase family protein [Limisphaerales bacterium]|nr:coproporphyrinogen III oxidase [Pedosphaera sp.]MBL6843249.1 coproporphyrinogen III oxidase family protein [Verrucomicrobiae bacterium]RZO70411.1 MAG: coproporphyrinogen III oxidase family protein [Limisphaerales bacterium]HAR00480.1 coproporphyrinogen III oxidase [Verrucomicrobiales bacterium]HAW02473.1 coproporphyrinogen III oxidase [Verrucomicrobiales bacterium]
MNEVANTDSEAHRQMEPEKKPTTAGNYFVSNYPPYSFWKPDHVGEFLEAIERPPSPDTKMGLYLHIPFCRKRCHFCYFKVYTDKNATAINGYLESAVKELEAYASKPFIGGRKPNFVYFGGGTPSYLSVPQLTSLTDRMKAVLPWDEAEEVAFECEPGTLTDQKLKAIRDVGVTRLSLGVEHFDDHILETNGRAHRSKEVFRAYQYAREIEFPQVNIDLIAGMLEETEEKWKMAVERTLELGPDSVTIYQMEVPFNTGIYRQMKDSGQLTAPVADWATKRRWVDYAFGELEKEGYTVTSAYTAVKDKARTKFIYRDRLWEGADLLSVGVASFGHIGGTHYQNNADFEPYVNAILDGNLPVFRALTPSNEERLIREFILQLKLGHTRCSYFDQKFGVNVKKKFEAPLKQIADWGFLKIDGDEIKLNREGLLQVDRLLHEFFLPQHLTQRLV